MPGLIQAQAVSVPPGSHSNAGFTTPGALVPNHPANLDWYAARTALHQELRAVAALRQKGIPAFSPGAPARPAALIHSDKRKNSLANPLFPGYVFVRIAPTPAARTQALRVGSLLCFVGNGLGPAVIPSGQIASLAAVICGDRPWFRFPYTRSGLAVRIRGGALDKVEGRLLGLKSTGKFIAPVDAIAKALAIELAGADLELIEL